MKIPIDPIIIFNHQWVILNNSLFPKTYQSLNKNAPNSYNISFLKSTFLNNILQLKLKKIKLNSMKFTFKFTII